MIIESLTQIPAGSADFSVFCDFDGTVAQRDVGYSLFSHFSSGKNKELLPDWKSKRLSTRDCLTMEAAMVNASASEILGYLDQFALDSGFAKFVTLCRGNDVPIAIISEGMDFYIEYILAKSDLSDLPVICNRGLLTNNRIMISFPFSNEHCDWCGSCKGERMAEYRAIAGDTRLVFVGDGYSDACAAAEADVLLAKKDLVEHCEAENIPYNSFKDFDDVTNHLFRSGRPIHLPKDHRKD